MYSGTRGIYDMTYGYTYIGQQLLEDCDLPWFQIDKKDDIVHIKSEILDKKIEEKVDKKNDKSMQEKIKSIRNDKDNLLLSKISLIEKNDKNLKKENSVKSVILDSENNSIAKLNLFAKDSSGI
jgi:hypothetical protein